MKALRLESFGGDMLTAGDNDLSGHTMLVVTDLRVDDFGQSL